MTAAVIAGELTVRAVSDAAGRTRIATLRQRYPQRMTAPLYCDPDFPAAATVCVQSPSGGAFSDDDLHTTVDCAIGSHLKLTTQAATQVFAGDGPGARHRLRFTVHAGAVLQYLPRTVIPQADASLTQSVEVDVACGGTYVGWEAVAAGRIAHGERFRYAVYDSSVTVRCDGTVAARDRQVIRPAAGEACLLDGDYLATLLVVVPGTNSTALLTALRDVLDALPGVRGGAGGLPGGVGVIVRLTTASAPRLRDAREALLDAACRGLPNDRGSH